MSPMILSGAALWRLLHNYIIFLTICSLETTMMHHICMRNLLDMQLALRNGISLWAGPQSHTQLSENGHDP